MAAGTQRHPPLTGAARWRKRKRPGARAGLWEGHGRGVARGLQRNLARLGVPVGSHRPPGPVIPIGREPLVALPERRSYQGSYSNQDASSAGRATAGQAGQKERGPGARRRALPGRPAGEQGRGARRGGTAGRQPQPAGTARPPRQRAPRLRLCVAVGFGFFLYDRGKPSAFDATDA